MLNKIVDKSKEILKNSLYQIQKYAWVVSIILSLAAFGFSLYNLKIQKNLAAVLANGNATGVSGQNSLPPEKFIAGLTGKEPMLGQKSAPVTMVEFADYQCPFCERFFSQSFPEIKQKYIDTGKVKFIFANVSFLGQESSDAAQAAQCAGEQNQYWAYHDLLYKNQHGENQGAFVQSKLIGFAEKLGLNTTDFNVCLTGHKYQKAVADATTLSQKYSVSGTPTFFINNKIIKGAQPASSIEVIIDSVLNNK